MAATSNLQKELEKAFSCWAYPEYLELLECRELIDDCLSGLRTSGDKGKYLPPNSWQLKHPTKYAEFLFRALFPNETKYSLDIYEGLFRLGSPTVNALPEDMAYMVRDASVYRDGLKDIQVRLNKEQMAHGLRMMLLETTESAERPFFIQEYGANSFIRAHFTKDIARGESIADCILLNESTIENDLASWSYIPQKRLRVLALDKNGNYYQRLVFPEELLELDVVNPPQDERTIYPRYRGRPYNRIPFVWCGASSLSGAALDYPLMLPMAQTELKLFLSMAHHSQHIYMNTQEAIVITGAKQNFKLSDDEFVAGAVVVIPGETAKAQYLSTNGVGFDAEEAEINMLMAKIGEQRMSLMQAKSHQSGTVVSYVQNSLAAPLRTVVDVSGKAITLILQHMARWMRHSEDEVNALIYLPSEEFANPRVNLSEFISLCKAVFAGEVQMLEEDLFQMAKNSGYMRGEVSWEAFKRKYNLEQEERDRRNAVMPTQSTGNPFPAAE